LALRAKDFPATAEKSGLGNNGARWHSPPGVFVFVSCQKINKLIFMAHWEHFEEKIGSPQKRNSRVSKGIGLQPLSARVHSRSMLREGRAFSKS
jgi:hypothetical protein